MFIKKNNEGKIAMLGNNLKIEDCEVLSTTKKKTEGVCAGGIAW